MKKLMMEPQGWKCTLEECPAGFFVFAGDVGFKTEYSNGNGDMEVFCSSGESFAGGTNSESERKALMVQPVSAVWVEME